MLSLHVDGCRRAGGSDKLTLLSGLERDTETSSTCHGAAPTKQLSNYRGSMPDTSDTTKVTARRGKGSTEVSVASAGHGKKKLRLDGVPSVYLPASRTGGEGAVWDRAVSLHSMSRITYQQGSVAEDLQRLLLSLPLCDAGRFHHLAACGMEKLGYWVKRNYLVADRGDGRRGKIDIVAKRGEEVVAIELDHVEPRAKSLYKIQNFTAATTKLVVCRYDGPTGGKYG